ncbi:deleted in malignant brain tumors 1 protein-like [Hemicordylus capensis]|uniref:deleted in malignant brain tumors 1 protein-like n=1 Tax=Hemicordylus capensis TaxID=884348 RepID=UPI002303FE65|nr:deleted in malignant brain tumors 1 protein-like [Hemicordylus capensis]
MVACTLASLRRPLRRRWMDTTVVLILLVCLWGVSAPSDVLVPTTDSAANPAELRLVNGFHRCSGRVEVYHTQYKTVCDDGWDLKEATVVCRQLDCGTAISVQRRAQFGQGSGPIGLDGVECTGTETSLVTCKHKPWESHDCNHGEDVGVVCSDDLRLVNGSNRCSGRVEFRPHHNYSWGTVCGHMWDLKDAEVVCKQLGCGKAVSASGGAHFGRGSGPIWLDGVNCKGTEDAIAKCKANNQGSNSCNHGQDAGVVCSESSTINMDTVRLAGGPNSCAGRVEVFYQQQWGTVCNGWSLQDASVVCKQLGCSKAVNTSKFGGGRGPIWLNNVKCMGSEQSLKDCKGGTAGEHDCVHKDDVGVVCSGRRSSGISPWSPAFWVMFMVARLSFLDSV